MGNSSSEYDKTSTTQPSSLRLVQIRHHESNRRFFQKTPALRLCCGATPSAARGEGERAGSTRREGEHGRRRVRRRGERDASLRGRPSQPDRNKNLACALARARAIGRRACWSLSSGLIEPVSARLIQALAAACLHTSGPAGDGCGFPQAGEPRTTARRAARRERSGRARGEGSRSKTPARRAVEVGLEVRVW